MKETSSKRYSHGNENLGMELTRAAYKMNANKHKGKEFDLIPQDMAVSKEKKPNEQYLNTFSNADQSYSRERVNTNSHGSSSHKKSEKDENASSKGTEKEDTAKMLINNPNLKKIKMFMEMESRNKNFDMSYIKSKTMGAENNIDRLERKPVGGVKVIPIKTNDSNFKRKGSDYAGCISLPYIDKVEEQEEDIKVNPKSKPKESKMAVNDKKMNRDDYDNGDEQNSEKGDQSSKRKSFNSSNPKEIRKKKYLVKEINDNDNLQIKSKEVDNEKYITKAEPKQKQKEEELKPNHHHDEDENVDDNVDEEHLRELEQFMNQNDINEVQFEEINNAKEGREEEEGNEEANENELINDNNNQGDEVNEEIDVDELNEEEINEINNEVNNEEELNQANNNDNDDNGVQMNRKRSMPEGHAEAKARYQTEENEQNEDEAIIPQPKSHLKTTIQPDNDKYIQGKNYNDDDEDFVKMQKTEENELNQNINTQPRLPLMSDIIGKDEKNINDKENPLQSSQSNLIPQSSIQYKHHLINEFNQETNLIPHLNYDYSEKKDFIFTPSIKANDKYQKQSIQDKPLYPLKEEYKKYDSRKQWKIEDYKKELYTKYENKNEKPTLRLVMKESIPMNKKTKNYIQQNIPHQFNMVTEDNQEKTYFSTRIYSSKKPLKNKWRVLDKTNKILNNSVSQSREIDQERKYEDLRLKYKTKEDENDILFTSNNYLPSSPTESSKYQSSHNSNCDCLYEEKPVMTIPNKSIRINKASRRETNMISMRQEAQMQTLIYSDNINKRNIKIKEETDQEKFNLNYNYSNDPLFNKIRHNELIRQVLCPKKLNNSCIISEDFIKNYELHQQIYSNNYQDIDNISNRDISRSSEDTYPIKKHEVSPYFNDRQSSINKNNNFYQSKTIFYQELPQEQHQSKYTKNQRCTCRSSREDLATIYLKAFPSFKFARHISDSPVSNPVRNYSKLCYKCNQEIRERDFINSLS